MAVGRAQSVWSGHSCPLALTLALLIWCEWTPCGRLAGSIVDEKSPKQRLGQNQSQRQRTGVSALHENQIGAGAGGKANTGASLTAFNAAL